MAFAPKAGCPMCSIVAAAAPDVLWRDDNFTAYRETVHPLSSQGHLIVAFNLHVPSIYTLSSSDLPLLVNIRNIATRFLTSFLPPSSLAISPDPTATGPQDLRFRIGFITPPFKDNKIPVTDHLHAHAYIAPADLMGWWRGIAYGPVAWYPIDDLIAEIRESVSNNRIKSGYDNRSRAPINLVPQAGARAGTADGIETSDPGLASKDGLPDTEEPSSPLTPALTSQSLVPPLAV